MREKQAIAYLKISESRLNQDQLSACGVFAIAADARALNLVARPLTSKISNIERTKLYFQSV
jgi:hypothetical protein